MKVVVTGGSGFIGSFIVEELASRGDEVVIVDIVPPEFDLPEGVTYKYGNVLYPDTMADAYEGAEEVYDVAGVLGTSELLADTARAIETNIKGAFNCLELARQKGVKRFFYPTKPNDWLNTYSITKHAGEQLCHMYRDVYDMDVTVLRWFNAYGGRQHLYPIRKAVPLFIIQAIRGLNLEVYGDGEQTVEMVYIEEMAKIVVDATRNSLGKKAGKTIDLGSGQVMTVNELCEAIIQVAIERGHYETDLDIPGVVHFPMRKGEPARTRIEADLADLNELMPNIEYTELKAGLHKTFYYYENLPARHVDLALKYFEENPLV
jgi:UDP-glucose 4-epimerase